MPLDSNPALRVLEQQSVVAVFVSDPERGPDICVQTLIELYDLTPAEAKIAARLAAGLSPAAIAEELDVQVNTVRVHMRAIFSKTQVRRQTDLVRLILTGAGSVGVRVTE